MTQPDTDIRTPEKLIADKVRRVKLTRRQPMLEPPIPMSIDKIASTAYKAAIDAWYGLAASPDTGSPEKDVEVMLQAYERAKGEIAEKRAENATDSKDE